MNGEPSRYRKIPVVVEAMQYGPYTAPSLGLCFFLDGVGVRATGDGIIIPTLEGDMLARPGDWIIKGVEGEFYPCKPDIFAKTYEPATGKEVMPSEPAGSAEGPRNTAPAGTDDAGGGAGQRAVQPDAAAIREAALREAAKVLANRADYLENEVKWGGSKQYLASLKGGAIELRHARNSILALINKPAVQPAHVNETPKSEHEKGDMLTPEPWNPATSPSMTDLMVDPDQMREDREERAMLAREDDQ